MCVCVCVAGVKGGKYLASWQETIMIMEKVQTLFHLAILCDPVDCSLPGSSIMGFSRQEYWSGLPLPSPIRPSSPPKCAFAIVHTSFPTSEGLETQHQPQDSVRG